MFIERAYNYLHNGWRYLVGALVIFTIWQLGSIPFAFIAMGKYVLDGGDPMLLEADQSLIMGVLDSNLTLFLMLLAFAIGLFGIWLWAKLVHGQPMTPLTTSRKKIDWKRFWFGFGIIGITTIVLTVIDYYSNPDSYLLQFDLVPFLILALIAIILVPLQTSFEEYFFRGYLMQGIGVSSHEKKSPIFWMLTILFIVGYVMIISNTDLDFLAQTAILTVMVAVLVFLLTSNVFDVLTKTAGYLRLHKLLTSRFLPLFWTSVIFGGLHFFNPEVDKLGPIIMVFYIGTGFFLGIITLMDEGMELAMGFHAANNLIAALLVTADWTAFQTHSVLKDISEPSAGADVLLPVLIIYPIFIGIMAWKYKWTGWKDKLFGNVTPPVIQVQQDIIE